MIDRTFGDLAQALLTPDFRLGDVFTQVLRADTPTVHHIDQPERSVFVFAYQGDFELEMADSSRPRIKLVEGAAAGFENGRGHCWRPVAGIATHPATTLFVSSVPRRIGVLQRMVDARIIIPPDAVPHATMMRHLVAAQICEHDHPGAEHGMVVRQCAELCLLQFIGYARATVALQPDSPPGLAHDANLLRAWTAYLSKPQRRWTLQSLAREAGLSRTVFAERFRLAFGAPALQTLTLLRLEQAKVLLLDGKAQLLEIAMAAGYNSEAAFVRAFRRQFGLPPGRFRKKQTSTVETNSAA